MAAKYLSLPLATVVDSGTETLISNGNNVTAQTATSMTDSTADFIALDVKIGDLVTDTVNNDTANVTAITSATELAISANIFSAALETYSITAATTNELYDGTQNFLTTVSPGDVIYNTTDNTSARVTSVSSNFRLVLSGDIMAVGETYNVLDEVTSDEQLVSLENLMLVQTVSQFSTELKYGALAGNDTVTIAHSDQGVGNLVKDAVQLAMQDAVSAPGSIPRPSSQEVLIGLNSSLQRVLINSVSIA
jgi:hypothetical protein